MRFAFKPLIWTEADRRRQSERMKEQQRLSGRSGAYDLWTPKEVQVVLRYYPDYKRIAKCLPNRSQKALEHKAERLGITPKMKKTPWTGAQLKLLKQLYATVERTADLQMIFSGRTQKSISRQAEGLKLKRRSERYKATGHPLIDQIRRRAVQLNYSSDDIDALARAAGYFRKRRWKGCKSPSHPAILRAIAALGGRVNIIWD